MVYYGSPSSTRQQGLVLLMHMCLLLRSELIRASSVQMGTPCLSALVIQAGKGGRSTGGGFLWIQRSGTGGPVSLAGVLSLSVNERVGVSGYGGPGPFHLW